MSLKYDKTDGTDYYRKSYMDNKKTYDKFMGSMSFRKSWEMRMRRHSEFLKPYKTDDDYPKMEDSPGPGPGPGPIPPIPGCLNPDALNYNPYATVSDGSCVDPWEPTPLPIPGCTNPTASNYNPNAQLDDGSCQFVPCPQPPCYDQTVWGCMDSRALNFNPRATMDDGSCEYGSDPKKPDQPIYPVNCWALSCFCPDREQYVSYKCTRPAKYTVYYRGLDGSPYQIPPDWIIEPHAFPQYVKIVSPPDSCSDHLIMKTAVFAPGEGDWMGFDSGLHDNRPYVGDQKWVTEWTIRSCGNYMGSECCPPGYDMSVLADHIFCGSSLNLTAPFSMTWEVDGPGTIAPKQGADVVYTAPPCSEVSGCETYVTIRTQICGTQCDSMLLKIMVPTISGRAGYVDLHIDDCVIWPHTGTCQARKRYASFNCAGVVSTSDVLLLTKWRTADLGYVECLTHCGEMYAEIDANYNANLKDVRTEEMKFHGCCMTVDLL